MTNTAGQWRTQAACREEDPDLFFPNGETGHWAIQIEEAKAVCRRCPVMETCLTWAFGTGQQAGIWGGTTEKERESLRRRRSRAAARSQQAEPAQTAPTCGTTAAYYQHLMAGEDIDAACQAASDGFEQQLTPPSGPPECGTRGGYQKHGRDGTEVCTPCRQANTDADRNLRNTGTTLAAA